MASKEINVPLLGSMPRGAVLAGGLAVVGVAGYLVYKHYKTPTTPATTPYSYGYGATAYGYGTYGYGGIMGGGFPGFYWPSGYGGPPPQPPQGPPTTNDQWFIAAIAAMGSSGTDHIGAVLAAYLAGTGIAKKDAIIVQEAIGFVGSPPVAGANGYPPKIRFSHNGGDGGGNATNPVTGLHVTKPGTTGVDIGWNPSKNATSYQVTSTHGNPGMTGATSARIHSIGRHTSATVSVLAQPAAQGAQPATLQVKTN